MATKNLLEAYRNRISTADALYTRTHNGQRMDNYRKLLIANALENTSNFLNEAFEQSAGTQRAALGDYKKFCLTLTTLALPNMIAPELVLTVPMASRTGFVAYLNYTAGSRKGGVNRGELFNGAYRLGEMTEDRMQYTGNVVVEPFTGDGTKTAFTLMWAPVYDTIQVTVDGTPVDPADYTVGIDTVVDKRWTKDTVTGDTTSSALIYNSVDANADTPANGKALTTITFTNAPAANAAIRIGYKYDNIVVPQNDIPQLNAEMAEVTLTAHARRIAVYYSQIANFQAKSDYGFDLGENMAKQAIGELQYEIDSEVVDVLHKAVDPLKAAQHVWSKTPGIGVSLVDHYAGFAKMFDEIATDVYNATYKFTPNYMVCARDVVTVLGFINGWQAAPVGQINGPYFAGTFNGVKVFVSPMLAKGEFFMGVNGTDLLTSAAVYGIYMPCVPTQLLGFADGAMSQGFSTLYDIKLLSKYTRDGKEYSPLLSGGTIVE